MPIVKPQAVVRAVRRGSTARGNWAAVCPFLGHPVLVSVFVFAQREKPWRATVSWLGKNLGAKIPAEQNRNKIRNKSGINQNQPNPEQIRNPEPIRNKSGTNKTGTHPEQIWNIEQIKSRKHAEQNRNRTKT
jgi:hypothetical protein